MFFDHLIFSLPSTNLKDFRDSNLLPLRDLFSFGFFQAEGEEDSEIE